MSATLKAYTVHPLAALEARFHVLKHSNLPVERKRAVLAKLHSQIRKTRLLSKLRPHTLLVVNKYLVQHSCLTAERKAAAIEKIDEQVRALPASPKVHLITFLLAIAAVVKHGNYRAKVKTALLDAVARETRRRRSILVRQIAAKQQAVLQARARQTAIYIIVAV